MKQGIEGKGIWVDGRASEEELKKLQDLFREAAIRHQKGLLPMSVKDSKIAFRAISKGETIVVFYGWNFPPENLWVKEEKGIKECSKCFSANSHVANREVWCEKQDYHFKKCPYGVETPHGHRPLMIGA